MSLMEITYKWQNEWIGEENDSKMVKFWFLFAKAITWMDKNRFNQFRFFLYKSE